MSVSGVSMAVDSSFHFVSSRAEVGTPSPAVTRQVAAFGTWAVLVPRNCRTPSLIRLKPWTYASESPPPPVFRGSWPPISRAPPP